MKGIITKDDKAVSPIIATILLIAITVVLAATLVTILGGFTHGASSSAATASVTTQFNSTGSTTTGYTTSIYLNVSSFSVSGVSSSKIDITLTVTNTTGSHPGTYTYTGNLGGSLTSTDKYAVATITITADPSSFTGGSSYVISITAGAIGAPLYQPTPAQTTSVTAQLSYSGSVIYTSSTIT